MSQSLDRRADQRLLVLPPTSRDGETTRALLDREGISVCICGDFPELETELERGAGAIVLTEEAAAAAGEALGETLTRQSPWSDLPVLILTRPGADSDESALAVRSLGNVTLLERPVRIASFLSAVRSALRARERQHQIRDQLAERLRVEESLRDSDRRKDEFLATLGHELRNPLAPLTTSLALLRHSGNGDSVAATAIEVIDRQVKHLTRLVDDLLEVSRITRGLIEVRREDLDLGEILRASVENARAVREPGRHAIELDGPAGAMPVRGDSVRLIQVFSNLLHNAAKYTNENGRIRVVARRDGGMWAVEVSDNGIGIAPENLGSIFGMFTQLDRSSRQAQGGLGIGLTLARSLVESHGGEILARSAGLGCGSTFEVRLPVGGDAMPPAGATAALPSLEGRSILVADDNRDGARALAALLRSMGARVVVAFGGPEALAKIERVRPEVAILDIGMPLMDGHELARRIRAAAWGREATLIALSGWSQERDVRRATLAGFDHHLTKPPDLKELCRIIVGRVRPTVRT